jgi:hypothetical protein
MPIIQDESCWNWYAEYKSYTHCWWLQQSKGLKRVYNNIVSPSLAFLEHRLFVRDTDLSQKWCILSGSVYNRHTSKMIK